MSAFDDHLKDEFAYNEMMLRHDCERAGRSFAAPTGLVCQWREETHQGKTVIATTCGNVMAAAIEDYGFRFCGNCGKPIDWQTNAGTQRPGIAEATNATKADMPGYVAGIIFAVSNDGGKTGVAWRENIHEAFAYLDLQNVNGGDYAVVAVRKPHKRPHERGRT